MDRLKEIEEISTVISCNSTFPHRVIAEKISNRVVDKARKEVAQEILQAWQDSLQRRSYRVSELCKKYGVEV